MSGDNFSFYLSAYAICLTSSASLAWGDFTQHPCGWSPGGPAGCALLSPTGLTPWEGLSGQYLLSTCLIPLGHLLSAGRISKHLGLLVSDKGTKEEARCELLSSLLPGAGALPSPSREAVPLTFLLLIQ